MNDSPHIPTRIRHDGWTGERRRAFLETLAKVGNVRDACRTIGLSNQAAYKLRARDPAFAADWDAALSAHGQTETLAREQVEALSGRKRRAPSLLRQLRHLDRQEGLIW